MQQQPQDVLKTLQHAHTKSSVDQTGMRLHQRDCCAKACQLRICLHQTLKADYISADGSDQNDAHGAQLGNVDIATAGHQVLFHKVLQGLQTAIQERLSRYATADVQTDTAALTKLRARANG